MQQPLIDWHRYLRHMRTTPPTDWERWWAKLLGRPIFASDLIRPPRGVAERADIVRLFLERYRRRL